MTYHLLAGLNSIAAKRGDGLHPKLLAAFNERRDIPLSVIDLMPHLTVIRQQAGPNPRLPEMGNHKNLACVNFQQSVLRLVNKEAVK